MLNKKKKNHIEEPANPENQDQKDVLQETEASNEEVITEPAGDKLSEEDRLKGEIADCQNKHLRLYAEFDNFKRRTSKERLELLQVAGKDVIVDLLPVIDDFERALKSMETATDIEAVKEGIKLVHNKLKNTLMQKGLKEMESIGTEFNADIHEGITNIPAPSPDMKGKVLDELEKGYYLNDKVIRFAKVIIGA